jgi:hypothetical protein
MNLRKIAPLTASVLSEGRQFKFNLSNAPGPIAAGPVKGKSRVRIV